MASGCAHLNQIKFTTTEKHVCEECVKMGDRWVHLRLCLECGNVGCCDSSKNKHATKHFHRAKHPIVKSIEPCENWGWCYIDEVELDFEGDSEPLISRTNRKRLKAISDLLEDGVTVRIREARRPKPK